MLKKMRTLLLLLPLFLFAGGQTSGNFMGIPVSESSLKANDETTILGFSFLSRITGQWNGPVYSSTPAGSSESWHVDFRPVSAGQVSQYTSMDTSALNYTSFFIVQHDQQLKVAMRTEGVFNNKGCVTYEVMDSVNEETGYYRFSDFQAGTKRAYTEFRFQEESFVMEVYTTKFNKVTPLQLHSRYEAKLGGREAAAEAIAVFKFPQPVMVKDFSETFKNMPESIYYTFENDPYPSTPQPYVGSTTVNITIDEALKSKGSGELFLLLTTKSLFEGIKYIPENLKYKSKYVFLPANTSHYTLVNVHPGTYFLYSFVDVNGDKKHLSGDYMSSDSGTVFTVMPGGNVTVGTKVDFIMP